MKQLLINLFYTLYNIIQMMAFMLVMSIDKFVIFIKKDNKMLDFIKKSL
jgi:hypothetical protein